MANYTYELGDTIKIQNAYNTAIREGKTEAEAQEIAKEIADELELTL
jgi:hypothetical protein